MFYGYYLTNMSKCRVKCCKNNLNKKGNRQIRFFRFPKDENLHKEWCAAAGIEKVTTKNPRICSVHFDEHCYKKDWIQEQYGLSSKSTRPLTRNAVPTLFLPQIGKRGRVRNRENISFEGNECRDELIVGYPILPGFNDSNVNSDYRETRKKGSSSETITNCNKRMSTENFNTAIEMRVSFSNMIEEIKNELKLVQQACGTLAQEIEGDLKPDQLTTRPQSQYCQTEMQNCENDDTSASLRGVSCQSKLIMKNKALKQTKSIAHRIKNIQDHMKKLSVFRDFESANLCCAERRVSEMKELLKREKNEQEELREKLKKVEEDKVQQEEKLKCSIPKSDLVEYLSSIFTPGQVKAILHPQQNGVVWSEEDFTAAASALSFGHESYEYWRLVRQMPMPAPSTIEKHLQPPS